MCWPDTLNCFQLSLSRVQGRCELNAKCLDKITMLLPPCLMTVAMLPPPILGAFENAVASLLLIRLLLATDLADQVTQRVVRVSQVCAGGWVVSAVWASGPEFP